MPVYRFTASLDNTITNALKLGLQTRATGSNQGLSDSLQVFSIYGQASGSDVGGRTVEKSRILIQFPVDEISAARDAGTIPASGSVNFYLRMFNAPHGQTLPKNYTVDISAVSGSWNEGTGLDMEAYKDKGSSNWVNAVGTHTAATATITALSKTAGQANTRTLVVTDVNGTAVTFSIDNSLTTSTATKIAFGNANSNATQFATNIAAAVNAATLDITASSDGATVTLTAKATGRAGNYIADLSGTAVTDSVVTIAGQWSGGEGKWRSQGADIYTDSSSSFSASFDIGTEDIELDITTLVEQWCSSSANSKTATDMGLKEDDGLMVKLSNNVRNDMHYMRIFFYFKFFSYFYSINF